MCSVQDSVIFRNILSTQECAAIWSDITRTRYYLEFEAGLAKAQGQLQIIPHEAANLIVEHCKIEKIDLDLLRQQTELIGYPVLGVVKQLVAQINNISPGLGEYTHYGATTQDVTDTATILQIRDTLDLLSISLENIITSLANLSSKHKSTLTAARSNLQQAVPVTFGFKLARLLATFLRHRTRLTHLRSSLLVLQFSGAAGTLATIPPTSSLPELGLTCQTLLAQHISLAAPEIAWHTERDRIADFGSLCAQLTSTCAKFALDIKLLTQTEIAEVSEPYTPHRGSSSTMPQKRNPISCAYITATAASVRQLSTSLFDAMIADHERSTGPWEIEWIVLPQIATLTHACMRHVETLVQGLEVHEEKMRANLEITRGAVVSEAVMMGLAKSMGRQEAHDLVYELCVKANEEGRPLVEVLCEHEEVGKKGREELERLCNPANYLGYSEVMVESVLQLVKNEDARGGR